MNPGEKIKLLRLEKGLSQAELAKAAGYDSRSSISKIEKGESDPSQKMLIKIANALDVKPSDLISDGDMESIEHQPSQQETTIQIVHPEIRILAKGLDQMPEAERRKALAMARTIFDAYAYLFDEKGATS